MSKSFETSRKSAQSSEPAVLFRRRFLPSPASPVFPLARPRLVKGVSTYE